MSTQHRLAAGLACTIAILAGQAHAQSSAVPTLVPGARQAPSARPGGAGTANPSQPAAPTAASGKFRVTANGFIVRQATRDHVLHIDGVGDEVYVSATVIAADSAQSLATPLATVESRVYGEKRKGIDGREIWPERSPMGTGTQRGGLRSGNIAPYSQPWKRKSQPTPDYLPLELWCGTLTEGQNAVVIVPTIWESDGESSTFSEWVNWSNSLAGSLMSNKEFLALIGAKASAVGLGVKLAIGAAVSLDSTGLIGGERDRPIGMRKSTTKPKTYDFVPPHRLVVNYRSADFSSRENAAGAIGGAAPGTFALEFADDAFFQGRYTMYVQIERIDGSPCAHEYVGPSRPKP